MAIFVENINERTRIPHEAILDVLEQIKTKFRPQKIILFGSYAYGNPRPESDVDLMVVMETELKQSEQALEILRKLDFRFGMDLIVRTPRVLKQSIEWGDFFLQDVVEKGIVLYDSSR
ncbi:MAG: nucleotidyltransferase domain-containing protein [bacterium]